MSNPDPKLFIIVGYDQPGSTWGADADRVAQAARLNGREVEIIGDGSYAPTLTEIRSRIAAANGPAEVFLSAHGENVPASESAIGVGTYALTLSDGVERPPQRIGTLPNGTVIDRSQIVGHREFLSALPPNTVGVFMGSCHSESALADVNLLPPGTRMYVSSTPDATTLVDASDSAMRAMTRLSSAVNDGSSLTEAYGNYIAGFENSIRFRDGTDWNAQTPTRFAVSGEGQIDLAQAARNLRGYEFSDGLYGGFADALGFTGAARERLVTSMDRMGDRITNGEVGSNQSLDNRAYNIVLTEIARVAQERGVSMTQALASMQQQAQANLAQAQGQEQAEAVPQSQAVASAAALGAALRNSPDMAALAAMQPASTDHQNVVVPSAAQSQGQARTSEAMIGA